MDDSDDATRAFLRSEHAALREEVLLRIRMQHQILLATWAAFGTLLTLASAWNRPVLFPLYVLLATFAAASWQHSGARTVQLKTYLRDDLEPQLVAGSSAPRGGWEAALAGMRVKGLLGACWFVSTKGFFIGSQSVATLGFVLTPWFFGGDQDVLGSRRSLLLLLALSSQVATMWILRYPQIERTTDGCPGPSGIQASVLESQDFAQNRGTSEPSRSPR